MKFALIVSGYLPIEYIVICL